MEKGVCVAVREYLLGLVACSYKDGREKLRFTMLDFSVAAIGMKVQVYIRFIVADALIVRADSVRSNT